MGTRSNWRVHRGVDTLTRVSSSGIPYLTPEIQLYYKSKSPRLKDQLDFDATLPLLSDCARFARLAPQTDRK